MGNSNLLYDGMTQELQVLLSHESKEWGTPRFYIELVRRVMGKIDLDPASCALTNAWIHAGHYFTIADDGLSKPWYGKVFVNPPYSKTNGRSNQDIWAMKLEDEYFCGNVTEAIILVKASLGYAWFKHLFKRWPCCLAYDLISFIDLSRPTEKPKPSKLGSAFFYLGPNYNKFEEVFQTIGKVIP